MTKENNKAKELNLEIKGLQRLAAESAAKGLSTLLSNETILDDHREKRATARALLSNAVSFLDSLEEREFEAFGDYERG